MTYVRVALSFNLDGVPRQGLPFITRCFCPLFTVKDRLCALPAPARLCASRRSVEWDDGTELRCVFCSR